MIQKGRQMLLHELSWSKEQLHDFISRGEIVLEKGIVRKKFQLYMPTLRESRETSICIIFMQKV